MPFIGIVNSEGVIVTVSDNIQGLPRHNNLLEEDLLPLIDYLFQRSGYTIKDISGIIAVQGPGGFSSLRLGLCTANAVGYAIGVPVVGIMKESNDCEGLVRQGIEKLSNAPEFAMVMPEYGSEPRITSQKKNLA